MARKTLNPSVNTGERIKIGQEQDVNYNDKHPVFCFKYICKKNYDFKSITNDECADFLDTITKLSEMTWNDIKLSSRHGKGTEKISIKSLKTKIQYPDNISPDNTDFVLALRYSGLKPFVGIRTQNIFHVLAIDPDFTLYKHS